MPWSVLFISIFLAPHCSTVSIVCAQIVLNGDDDGDDDAAAAAVAFVVCRYSRAVHKLWLSWSLLAVDFVRYSLFLRARSLSLSQYNNDGIHFSHFHLIVKFYVNKITWIVEIHFKMLHT